MKARRSKPTLASRLRKYWVAGLVALAAVAVLGRFALSAPQFRMQRLEVTGNARVPTAEIVARAGIDARANVWLVDARAVEARVDAIPFVKSAKLVRALPASARLEIVERKPDGCVREGGETATIDADRRVLEPGCGAPSTYDLQSSEPLTPGATLRDADLARLQADAHTLAASGRQFAELNLDEFGGVEGHLPGGILVRFGDDDDLDAKERLIGPILGALGPRAAGVSALDLRAPGTPVVEHRPSIHRSKGLSTPN